MNPRWITESFDRLMKSLDRIADAMERIADAAEAEIPDDLEKTQEMKFDE